LVSYRWVNYCIAKRIYIDPTNEKYFIFRPFFLNTPIFDFLKLKFVVLGYSDVLKERIYELLEVVGHRPVENFLSGVTHAICEPYFRDTEKNSRVYVELQKNPLIKYVKLNWIINSVD
jgi:hypothetical protein